MEFRRVLFRSDAICIIEYFIFDIDLTIQLDGLRSFRYIERRKIRITIILHDASNPVFLTIIAFQSQYASGPDIRFPIFILDQFRSEERRVGNVSISGWESYN